MKQEKRILTASIVLLLLFIIWTWLVCLIDVQPVGPQGSSVGFAALNQGFHQLAGVNTLLCSLTDWGVLIPLLTVLCFGALGVFQWIGRKSLLKVDRNLLLLGGFYVVVLSAWVLFEVFIVNYRPVLMDGVLEASYPSSATMIALCVMPTAMMQFDLYLKNRTLKHILRILITVFIAFMVIGRLLSGVHWLTDIIGGILLSAGLVLLYRYLIKAISF